MAQADPQATQQNLAGELDEDSAVRLLLAGGSADEREQACRRATRLLEGIDGARRPFAALHARLLVAETHSRTGEPNALESAAAVRQCEAAGLPRLLVDAVLGDRLAAGS